MNLPSDTPKMQKWMFLLGDAILLAVAWFIHDGAEHPYAGLALISTVACVMLAVVIGVIPFVTEYARRQDEALDNRHRSLQALAVTVAAASEQVSIAATGLNGISEAAQDNYSKTERLAKQIADKVAELDEQLAKVRYGDNEATLKMEAFLAKMAKTGGDIEAALAKAAETRKSAKAAAASVAAAAVLPEPAPVIASTIPEVKPAAVASEPPFVPPAAPVAEPEIVVAPPVLEAPKPEPVPEPVAAPAPVEAVKEEPSPAPVVESAAPLLSDPMETMPPVALPPRKRAPKKPAVEPAPAPEPEIPAPAVDLVLESPAEDAARVAQEIFEPAVSADGATRLIVTAYIGIGNRLFIRGDGPGLSWDKGIPLTFVSIGKWRWETNDATSTIRFRLFKNDTIECTALGEAAVEPGAQQELSAAF